MSFGFTFLVGVAVIVQNWKCNTAYGASVGSSTPPIVCPDGSLKQFPETSFDIYAITEDHTEYCPQEIPNLKSSQFGGIGPPTKVHFRNDLDKPVELYWVNDSGGEVLIRVINPNIIAAIRTRIGHMFHVRLPKSEDGVLLLRHRVGVFRFANPDNVPCSSSRLQVDEELRNRKKPPVDCGFIYKPFQNQIGCDVNIYFVMNNGTELLVEQLGASGHPLIPEFSHHATYFRHRFRARLEDGRLVQERQMDALSIPPCTRKRKLDAVKQVSTRHPIADEIMVGSGNAPAMETLLSTTSVENNKSFCELHDEIENSRDIVAIDKITSSYSSISSYVTLSG